MVMRGSLHTSAILSVPTGLVFCVGSGGGETVELQDDPKSPACAGADEEQETISAIRLVAVADTERLMAGIYLLELSSGYLIVDYIYL